MINFLKLLIIALFSTVTLGCVSTLDISTTDESSKDQLALDDNSHLIDKPDAFLLTRKTLTDVQKEYTEDVRQLITQQKWSQARIQMDKFLPSPSDTAARTIPSSLWVLAGDIERGQAAKTDEHATQQALLNQASILYQTALKANEHNYQALNRLGATARSLGQFDQALAFYDRAVEIKPSYPNAFLNRGILHDLYLGNKSAAVRDYQQVQTLNKVLKRPENRQVSGWLIDLNRQLASTQQGQNYEQ